ncbi:MAG: FprA family A-type flavoprotein [Candidatus Zixiibacteriota bacterium]
MNALKISDHAHWIGVKDPDLKVFDIIMATSRGTTYNAYLAKGTKTTVLIDTVKREFSDEYFEHIEALTKYEDIQYLVVNHTEPDHSGAIVELLERCPKLQIICSASALPFVKNVINVEAPITGIKDDYEIDLGGAKLVFKILPYMHWPDTMMEYLVEDKVLFSCDGFAAHLAGSSPWADECPVDAMEFEFKYYFDAIMRPFCGYIRRNLPKLDSLDIAMIAPSHGPIIRKNPRHYIDLYKEWTVDRTEGSKRVTIFYATNYGNTRKMASAIASNLLLDGYDTTLMDVTACSESDARDQIERSVAVIIGTPTFNGDAPKPIWDVVNLFATVYSIGKKAAVFGSYGWGGEGAKLVTERLTGLKLKVYPEPFRARLIPSEKELAELNDFSRKLVEFLNG